MRLILVTAALAVLWSSSVAVASVATSNNNFRVNYLTPLLNEDHPCMAENLQETDRYICTSESQMVCLEGWSEPDNYCMIPVCNFTVQVNGVDTFHGCANGVCTRPQICSCDVGWSGPTCDTCIPKPGCSKDHGRCVNEPMQCVCIDDTKWTGPDCDVPVCKAGCEHGFCTSPGECICEDGWEGENCDKCITLPGCDHGECVDRAFECKCNDGWAGALCDCPICKKGCNLDHGYCENMDGVTSECLCLPGWKGESCSEPIPYPYCPEKDQDKPWECVCKDPKNAGNVSCTIGTDPVLEPLPELHHHDMSASCKIINGFPAVDPSEADSAPPQSASENSTDSPTAQEPTEPPQATMTARSGLEIHTEPPSVVADV